MTIVLETADNAEIYMFKGSDRASAESLIDEGDRLYPGNPLRFSDLDDLLIVFRKTFNGQSSFVSGVGDQYETLDGSFSLNYEVSGIQYSFWQRPFVYHDDDAYWWTFRIGSGLFILLALAGAVYGFIARPLCLKKPICCLCCYDKNNSLGLDNEIGG